MFFIEFSEDITIAKLIDRLSYDKSRSLRSRWLCFCVLSLIIICCTLLRVFVCVERLLFAVEVFLDEVGRALVYLFYR